jgi:hypothetical protein
MNTILSSLKSALKVVVALAVGIAAGCLAALLTQLALQGIGLSPTRPQAGALLLLSLFVPAVWAAVFKHAQAPAAPAQPAQRLTPADLRPAQRGAPMQPNVRRPVRP